MESQDAVTMYARAKLAEKEKNFEQAIEEYEKLLKLQP